jgi:hypothetical protein
MRRSNYAHQSKRQWLLLARIDYGPVLVAFIQRVIGPFHEHFSPFDQAGREQCGESADEDLLEKRGLHTVFESNGDASKQTLCGRNPA